MKATDAEPGESNRHTHHYAHQPYLLYYVVDVEANQLVLTIVAAGQAFHVDLHGVVVSCQIIAVVVVASGFDRPET